MLTIDRFRWTIGRFRWPIGRFRMFMVGRWCRGRFVMGRSDCFNWFWFGGSKQIRPFKDW